MAVNPLVHTIFTPYTHESSTKLLFPVPHYDQSLTNPFYTNDLRKIDAVGKGHHTQTLWTPSYFQYAQFATVSIIRTALAQRQYDVIVATLSTLMKEMRAYPRTIFDTILTVLQILHTEEEEKKKTNTNNSTLSSSSRSSRSHTTTSNPHIDGSISSTDMDNVSTSSSAVQMLLLRIFRFVIETETYIVGSIPLYTATIPWKSMQYESIENQQRIDHLSSTLPITDSNKSIINGKRKRKQLSTIFHQPGGGEIGYFLSTVEQLINIREHSTTVFSRKSNTQQQKKKLDTIARDEEEDTDDFNQLLGTTLQSSASSLSQTVPTTQFSTTTTTTTKEKSSSLRMQRTKPKNAQQDNNTSTSSDNDSYTSESSSSSSSSSFSSSSSSSSSSITKKKRSTKTQKRNNNDVAGVSTATNSTKNPSRSRKFRISLVKQKDRSIRESSTLLTLTHQQLAYQREYHFLTLWIEYMLSQHTYRACYTTIMDLLTLQRYSHDYYLYNMGCISGWFTYLMEGGYSTEYQRYRKTMVSTTLPNASVEVLSSVIPIGQGDLYLLRECYKYGVTGYELLLYLGKRVLVLQDMLLNELRVRSLILQNNRKRSISSLSSQSNSLAFLPTKYTSNRKQTNYATNTIEFTVPTPSIFLQHLSTFQLESILDQLAIHYRTLSKNSSIVIVLCDILKERIARDDNNVRNELGYSDDEEDDNDESLYPTDSSFRGKSNLSTGKNKQQQNNASSTSSFKSGNQKSSKHHRDSPNSTSLSSDSDTEDIPETKNTAGSYNRKEKKINPQIVKWQRKVQQLLTDYLHVFNIHRVWRTSTDSSEPVLYTSYSPYANSPDNLLLTEYANAFGIVL